MTVLLRLEFSTPPRLCPEPLPRAKKSGLEKLLQPLEVKIYWGNNWREKNYLSTGAQLYLIVIGHVGRELPT